MDISETVEVQGHEKCIFETPYDVFWVSKNQISMEKKIKIFTFAYGQGAWSCLVLVRNEQKINSQTQGVPAICDWASALHCGSNSILKARFFWCTLCIVHFDLFFFDY